MCYVYNLCITSRPKINLERLTCHLKQSINQSYKILGQNLDLLRMLPRVP